MTTPTTRDEFFQALNENRNRPKGRATAAVAEELVEAAEEFGDPEVTVSALVELMRAYHGSGESVKYPVAFARLLRLWDEDPKAFDESETHSLFWFFKWVSSGLLSTPDVPLASVRGWIAEMRRRYLAAGHDLQPVYAQEYFLARQLGENEELAHELWATRGRTEFSDCAACEARARAGHHIRHGADEQGLAELQPTFDGRHTCDEEPHNSQALALLPLLRLGRLDEARAAHLTGYRKVRGREAELTPVGRHLEFCALTGNEARGLELLAQNRPLFDFAASPSSSLDFLTGVEVLLARLVGTGHGQLPCAGPLGKQWTVASLRDTVAAQADELAARFDVRNGNGAVSARRRERLAARPLVAQLNLGVQISALEQPVGVRTGPAASSVGAEAPGVQAPEDFAELVAELRRLVRIGHPGTQALWAAVLERADDAGDAVDDLLRGEIATEVAQRAYNDKDWDACAALEREAVEHYTRGNLLARTIAAEARLAWCGATREDLDPEAAAAAAEAAWPVLDELLARIEALAGSGLATDEEQGEVLGRKLAVRQCRLLTARHAFRRARHWAEPAEQRAHWSGLFTAEAQALIAEGTASDRPFVVSVTHEVLAEFQARVGDPVVGEASARRAVEIFTERDWPWRMYRGRMLLALALNRQQRFAEATAEAQLGLSEATPDAEPKELTSLHLLLGNAALRAGQFPTAVRAFSEAAARLDRDGGALPAMHTRWELSRALRAQGSTGDAVAVLESLLDRSAPEAPSPATADATDDATSTPTEAEQLTAQIRSDLATSLLALGEPRDAAREYLLLADAVSRWSDGLALTSAAAGAAGALAAAGNWEEARAALERALTANAAAPCLPALTDALRSLAVEAVDARGAAAAEEALGYLDRADRLREEFPDAAAEQFVSAAVDMAQCSFTRGQVHATAGHAEEALAAFDLAITGYDQEGHATALPRFEAVRMAALMEGRNLGRVPAARERLAKAAAEADAAGRAPVATTLRRIRDSLG